jgi:hypothetical protein
LIILLAFFIVINAFSDSDDQGFRHGIGQVRDAFGLSGGLGLLNYHEFGRSKRAVAVPNELTTDGGLKGFHSRMLEGAGGVGMTDQEVDTADLDQYLLIPIPFEFEPDSDVIPAEMAAYLNVTGMGFAIFDYRVAVRSFSARSELGHEENAWLATRRATAVMRYLNRSCGVPFDRLTAAGYGTMRYEGADHGSESADQRTAFYVFTRRRDSAPAGSPP